MATSLCLLQTEKKKRKRQTSVCFLQTENGSLLSLVGKRLLFQQMCPSLNNDIQENDFRIEITTPARFQFARTCIQFISVGPNQYCGGETICFVSVYDYRCEHNFLLPNRLNFGKFMDLARIF